MGNKEKALKIIHNIYREVYAELGLDFDSFTEKNRDGWFNHFYMSTERQDEILKKHLKYQRKPIRDIISLNFWLGCSPCSRDFYYRLTKKNDVDFIKESKRVKWFSLNEKGVVESFVLPSSGRNLIMSPFNAYFTWATTPVIEVIENKDWNRIEFKTKNSHYYLDRVGI